MVVQPLSLGCDHASLGKPGRDHRLINQQPIGAIMPETPEDPVQAQWDLDERAIQAWLADFPADNQESKS